MIVTVEIKGSQKIDELFKKMGAQAEKVFGMAVDIAGQKFRDFVKQMPAVSARTTGYSAKGMPTDTGNLRRSIEKRKISALAAGVFVGKPAERYGVPVHEGHRTRGGTTVPARPFMQWALETGAQKEIDDTMEEYATMLLNV